MKTLLIAAAGIAALALAAPASAQTAPYSGVNWYGNLGYTDFDASGGNLSAITGRLGARFGQYFGVEGELSGGLGVSHASGGADVHLNNQEALYGVAFLPLSPNADLFARGGYGWAAYHTSLDGVNNSFNGQSWNFGAGGQYFFDHANGVRVDYTREEATNHGPDANVWGVSYVHKF
jgi:hypothetical protein